MIHITGVQTIREADFSGFGHVVLPLVVVFRK